MLCIFSQHFQKPRKWVTCFPACYLGIKPFWKTLENGSSLLVLRTRKGEAEFGTFNFSTNPDTNSVKIKPWRRRNRNKVVIDAICIFLTLTLKGEEVQQNLYQVIA